MFCCKGGGDEGHERVFGAVISEMDGPDIDEDEVPMLVTETIAYLKSKGLDSGQAQGIFRKSANAVKLRQIKTMYNAGEKVDYEELGQVSSCANALKAFFRELREPAFNTASYSDIIQLMDEGKADEDEKIAAIKVILLEHISSRNLTLLRILFYFIAEVGSHHEKNGMTCKNLAIVFGPNLIWAKGAGPDSGKIPQLSHLKHVSDFIEFGIEHRVKVFDLEKEGYRAIER